MSLYTYLTDTYSVPTYLRVRYFAHPTGTYEVRWICTYIVCTYQLFV